MISVELSRISNASGCVAAFWFAPPAWLHPNANNILQLSLLTVACVSISFLALSIALLIAWKRSTRIVSQTGIVAASGIFTFLCAILAILGIWVLVGPQTYLLALMASLAALIAVGTIVLLPFLTRSLLHTLVNAEKSRIKEAQFLAVSQATQDALLLLEAVRDPNGYIEDFRFSYLNEQAEQIFNVPRATMLGARVSQVLPSHRDEGFLDLFKKVVLTGKPHLTEFSIKDPQINATWLCYSVVKLEDGVAISASDLTGQKDTESSIRHTAQHDPLTGLPNRALLDDRIQQAIGRAVRYRQNAAVLLLDLDNFKFINDTYGHAAGDEVLKTVATRLRGSVRATDSIFRLGGDEFVIVLGDLATKGPIVDFTRKICVNLLPPIPWEQEVLNVSASIGVANYPGDGVTPEALLIQADIAMYRMKRGRTAASDTLPAERDS